MCDCIPDDPLTLSEACMRQAENENDMMWWTEYIDRMSNTELINFLERVQKNYGGVMK